MTTLPENWLIYDSAEAVAQAVVEQLLTLSYQAIKTKGAFHLVTAGGTTPNRCYQLLREQTADWKHWHIYMGDERVCPSDDKDRNSLALLDNWLDFKKIPNNQIHFIPTELGVSQAVKAYSDLVSKVKKFDVCLLGMGEDGHTASLFPGHDYPFDSLVLSESDSPKPPPQRVSLSFKALRNSHLVLKIITGASKQSAIRKWLAGEELPIVKATGEQTYTYLSRDALPPEIVVK